MKIFRFLLLISVLWSCSSGDGLQREENGSPKEENPVDKPDDLVIDEGTGTKVVYEKDHILYTFVLQNKDGNADSLFLEGEQISFCFSVTNNSKEDFPYDYRDIGQIKEFGVIYNAENDEYVGKAFARSTTEGRQCVSPGETNGYCIVYPFVEPSTYSHNSESLKKGRYYTKFEGDLPCESFVIALPEFRIDFVVE